MTATAAPLNTQPVETSRQTARMISTLPKQPGRLFPVTGVDEVRYSDGSTLYICVDCGWSSPNMGSTRAHRGAHRRSPKRKAQTGPTVADALNLLAEFVNAGGRDASLVAERDEWKRRAKDAERRLASLRRALGTQ